MEGEGGDAGLQIGQRSKTLISLIDGLGASNPQERGRTTNRPPEREKRQRQRE